MTKTEANCILVEALSHEPVTRVDYFRKIAVEGNHDPMAFYQCLAEAWQEMSKYVCTPVEVGTNNGNPVFAELNFHLPEWTNNRHFGSLTKSQILEIGEPLHQLGKIIAGQIVKLFPPPPKNPEPVTDYGKYLVESGLYEKFAQSNITIRLTDSLEVMRKQSVEKFTTYLEELKREGKKRGEPVNLHFAELAFLQSEIELFTGFLEKKLPANDEIIVMEFIQELKNKLHSLGRPKPHKTSLSWTGSPEQLDALCDGLAVAGYIDQGAGKEAFNQVFSGNNMNPEPVTWKGTNRLLAYMFDQITKGRPPLVDNNDWQSIIDKNQIFKNGKEKPIKAGDLSTALSQINSPGLEPKGHEKIDNILESVRSLRP